MRTPIQRLRCPFARTPREQSALTAFGLFLFVFVSAAPAQVYEKVFSFTDARVQDIALATNKGSLPYGGLVEGSDGNFYGTTNSGGTGNFGTIFKMTRSGVVTTLVLFTGNGASNKGSHPFGQLVLGTDGKLYGTTQQGGANNLGTVFKVSTSGTLTTLVEFTGNGANNRGSTPTGNLVQGTDGNFYGVTYDGGFASLGTVYQMTPSGVLTTQTDFGSGNLKGALPLGGLVQSSDGNFYGMTQYGGAGGSGTIFKVVPGVPYGVMTTLFEFPSFSGSSRGAVAALVEGADGNFYGTTRFGGTSAFGTAFKVTPGGVFTTLLNFTANGPTNKGSYPFASLMRGSDGNFYGTTGHGGANDLGTVFKMTPGGVLTTISEFTGNGGTNKGSDTRSGLVQSSDGNFYGTTSAGGANGLGTVYKITAGGSFTSLVDFIGNVTSNTGSQPWAGLVLGNDGNFYGTTRFGGSGDSSGVAGNTNGFGTVFKMTPSGTITTLVQFTNAGTSNRGGGPGGLIQGSDGNFYGTTLWGGQNSFTPDNDCGCNPSGTGYGTVFKMTPAGSLTTLVEFTDTAGARGRNPAAGLVQGNDGNFYGTTRSGGTSNAGTVFKVTPNGVLTTLLEFTAAGATNKGANPYDALVLSRVDGNFYGTTYNGGSPGSGTVFRMTPDGILTTLLEFPHNAVSIGPRAGLVEGNDGNFYGSIENFGGGAPGSIFKITPGGSLTTLVQFTYNGASNTGAYPYAALLQADDGNFYGTTLQGGQGGNTGTVFAMTPGGVLTTLFDFQNDPVDADPNGNLVAGPDGNLYGTTQGGPSSSGAGGVYRLIFPGVPNVYPLGIQVQGADTAAVQALVNARSKATTTSVEYGTDGSSFPNNVPLSPSPLTGYRTTLVGTTLSGLAQGVTYYYRIRAINSFGTTLSPVASFSTLAQPLAAVAAASNIVPTSAQLNGIVNARNYSATVVFQYGTDGNTFPNQVLAAPGTVTGNTDTAVSAAVAGLTKGTTYYYRVVATNAGGTTVSGQSTFTTLTEPTATVGGAVALSTISARVSGSINAQRSDTQVVFEYGTDGIAFPNSVAAVPPVVSGNSDTPVSADLTNLSQGATYYYRIRATSAGGVGVSTSASFSLNILSGLTQVFPGAPPSAQGFVFVTLIPSGIQSGWRFVGEQLWRPSGIPVGGLTTGDRQIEFRPVPGYIQPLTETVTVTSGAPATQVPAEYFPTSGGQAGGLEIVLKPDSIEDPGVPVVNRGQWRFLGEDDTQWRNSGVTVSGLLPGKYLVECKPIPGRNTPSANVVPVQSNQTTLATITYYSADATAGATPSVLPFQTVSTTQSLPYAYVGQIRSDVGSATGFVVNRRVVATAGHVVFDDGTLSYVTGLQWLLQRDAGTYDPIPQIPQGFYVFDGYATQRTAENTPGQSSVASQNLDVAALYFPADAGRGGYAGYLASDSTDNEFLTSSKLKMVVGYPVNGIPSSQQGRMFATSPFNVTFSRVPGTDGSNNPYRVYTTQDITSAGGNSGGPICVLYDNGSYYPAAIYLGGSAQTSVRTIDSKVVDLFGRAEVSGDGGGNQVGGGIIQVNTPISGAIFSAAALKVNLSPGTAVSGGAMWSLSPTDVPFSNGFERDNLNPVGTYTLYFAPATGFLTPPSATITLTAGQLSTVTRTYFGVTTQPQNQIAPAGSNVAFTVATSGTPTGYQWRRNGFDIGGATASSYTLNNVTSNDTATYSCVVTWTEVAPSTVTGPVSQTSSAATLTVTDTFASWSGRFFTPTELNNSQISDPTADPDGDGVPNLLEFAFNLQPRIDDGSVMFAGTGTSGLPLVMLETISNQKVLTIEFVRRRAAGSPGITYHAEFGSDLTNPSGWSETGSSIVTQVDDTWERVKVTDSLANQSKRFGRVRVTMP